VSDYCHSQPLLHTLIITINANKISQIKASSTADATDEEGDQGTLGKEIWKCKYGQQASG